MVLFRTWTFILEEQDKNNNHYAFWDALCHHSRVFLMILTKLRWLKVAQNVWVSFWKLLRFHWTIRIIWLKNEQINKKIYKSFLRVSEVMLWMFWEDESGCFVCPQSMALEMAEGFYALLLVTNHNLAWLEYFQSLLFLHPFVLPLLSYFLLLSSSLFFREDSSWCVSVCVCVTEKMHTSPDIY